jgi:hypothetical protein
MSRTAPTEAGFPPEVDIHLRDEAPLGAILEYVPLYNDSRDMSIGIEEFFGATVRNWVGASLGPDLRGNRPVSCAGYLICVGHVHGKMRAAIPLAARVNSETAPGRREQPRVTAAVRCRTRAAWSERSIRRRNGSCFCSCDRHNAHPPHEGYTHSGPNSGHHCTWAPASAPRLSNRNSSS